METSPDSNNNTTEEKSYSLRPRVALKKGEDDTDHEESWRPRARLKRRSKQKGLPLSKYRRKTANARERSRMREINEAFEVLRKTLPHLSSQRDNSLHEKTTKIMTLRLAMKYISALDNALRQADLDSDGDSVLSDHGCREHSLTPSSHSEPSDILDQLFDECPPSSSSSSCAISPSLDGLQPPTLGDKLDPCTTFLKTLSPVLNIRPRKVPRFGSLEITPTTTSRYLSSELSSVAQTYSFPQVDLLNPLDVQDYVPSSWRELDCLPSPPLNLDDIFIT